MALTLGKSFHAAEARDAPVVARGEPVVVIGEEVLDGAGGLVVVEERELGLGWHSVTTREPRTTLRGYSTEVKNDRMTAQKAKLRFALKRLVALSSTTFAMLIFIVHDAVREELRGIRDDVALADSNNREIEYKHMTQERLREILAKIGETALGGKNPTESEYEKQVAGCQERIIDINTQARMQLNLLAAAETLMGKLPQAFQDYHAARLATLKTRVLSNLTFAAILFNGPHAQPDFDDNGVNFFVAPNAVSGLGIIFIAPALQHSDVRGWMEIKEATEHAALAISTVEDHSSNIDSAIHELMFSVRDDVETRLQDLNEKYVFWTHVSYVLYFVIFAFNVWVVFFTKLKPEAPE